MRTWRKVQNATQVTVATNTAPTSHNRLVSAEYMRQKSMPSLSPGALTDGKDGDEGGGTSSSCGSDIGVSPVRLGIRDEARAHRHGDGGEPACMCGLAPP